MAVILCGFGISQGFGSTSILPVKATGSAAYVEGNVELTYADFSAVDFGEGTIEVWDKTKKVAELSQAKPGDSWNSLVYNLTQKLEEGTYQLRIPTGAVLASKDSELRFMSIASTQIMLKVVTTAVTATTTSETDLSNPETQQTEEPAEAKLNGNTTQASNNKVYAQNHQHNTNRAAKGYQTNVYALVPKDYDFSEGEYDFSNGDYDFSDDEYTLVAEDMDEEDTPYDEEYFDAIDMAQETETPDGDDIDRTFYISMDDDTDQNGLKHKEHLFSLGDLGNEMLEEIAIESSGVRMTTEDFYNANIDFNVPVRYNQMDNGEVYWQNGTKLIFSAKDNITGITIEGDAVENASSDSGEYIDGCWVGKIVAGDTLKLVSKGDINIHAITIYYNGINTIADQDGNKAEEIDPEGGSLTEDYMDIVQNTETDQDLSINMDNHSQASSKNSPNVVVQEDSKEPEARTGNISDSQIDQTNISSKANNTDIQPLNPDTWSTKVNIDDLLNHTSTDAQATTSNSTKTKKGIDAPVTASENYGKLAIAKQKRSMPVVGTLPKK